MRLSCILILSALSFAQAPPTPATKKADGGSEIVATVGDKQYTADEVRDLINTVPPQYHQAAMADKKNALQQILMMKELAAQARKDGLENKSPYKEQIEFFLAQSAINDYSNRLVIPYTDVESYYKAHPDEFEQAKVRMIQISFSSGQVKSNTKVRTEAEAKAKADELRQKLAAGADFAAVAKENSDDKETADKGGEWGVIKRNSKLPEDVKKAVFTLKTGEVSEPLRQPNGFYLIKLEEKSVQPLNSVAPSINDMLKQQKLDAWTQAITKRFEVKVDNPDFFKSQPVTPASR